jgi:hypothetical protein
VTEHGLHSQAGQSTVQLAGGSLVPRWQPQSSLGLYDVSQDDASKNKVGGVITLNPYVAATKFVMEKNAPEKTVKKTASEISAQVVTQMKQYGARLAPK